MNNEIKSRIRRVLSEKMLQGAKFADDTPLIELGVGLDSIAVLELIVALEKEFRIPIDEGEITLEVLATLNSVSEYIESLIGRERG